jgi:regulator of sirC expression with transglutaminase-like and TPR domain
MAPRTRTAVFLCALALLGCRQREAPPITTALLYIGAPSSKERNSALDALSAVAARVEPKLAGGTPPLEAFNGVLFGELGFVAESNEGEPRFSRLPSVLAGHHGSSLGLCGLYLALGELLGPRHGFTVDAVLVPGHLFVRVAGHNVEPLRRGETLSDGWYRQQYEVPETNAPGYYLRPLTATEVMAVFDEAVADDLRVQARYVESAIAYRRAAAAFPELAEAKAGLGLVRHLAGHLEEAEAAYQAAYAANPRLRGLEKNRALLRAEMARPKN